MIKFLGFLNMLGAIILAGIYGSSEKTFIYLIIPFAMSTFGYYLYRKDHLAKMTTTGMNVYNFKFLISTIIAQSILPIICYLIFLYIF